MGERGDREGAHLTRAGRSGGRAESGLDEAKLAQAAATDGSESSTSSSLVGLVVFLAVLVGLLALSWDDVTEPRFEDGDFAANSILIDSALSFELFHGNYSRAGFYHPGPALLGAQATGQAIVHDGLGLVPTPYNGHLIGILALNAALLGLAASILFRNTESLWSVAILVVASLAFSLAFGTPGLGGLLTSTWMPHVYVWPYLLLLISSASVAIGRGDDIWKLMLAGGLLVHGHVSFFLPVAAFFASAVIAWGIRTGKDWHRALNRRQVLAAIGVLTVFALPLAIQVISDFPGQFDDYATYIRETDLPTRGLESIARFVAQYWGFGAVGTALIPVLFVAALASAITSPRQAGRVFGTALVMACAIASLTTAVYAFSGVDDLTHEYLALFYTATPILIWTVLASNVLDRATPGRPWLGAVAISALVLAPAIVMSQPGSQSLYGGSEVGEANVAVNRAFSDTEPLALILQEHEVWPAAVGLVEQAARDGRPICARVEPGVMQLIFTDNHVCGEDAATFTEAVVTRSPMHPNETAQLLYDGDSFDLWVQES